jgi:hypothetical protein
MPARRRTVALPVWLAWLATGLVTAAVAAWMWPTSALSWHFFRDGAASLAGDSGLRLYADHPELQVGPVAFGVAWLLTPLGATGSRVAAQLLMAGVGPLCIALLVPVLPASLRGRRVWWAALAVVPGWVVLSVRWSHLDDVLAMLFTIVALRFVLRGRPVWAGAMVALAASSKPWAIDFAPMLLALDRRAWRAALLSLAGGLVVLWGPFVVAAPATLSALKPNVLLAPGSGLYALGVRGDLVPAWDRTVAFLAATGTALVAQLRGRWAGVLVVAVAVRIALDPQDNAYYVGSIALAAAVYDLFGTRWRGPWLTLVSTAVFWQPFTADWTNRLTTTTGYAQWWFAHPEAVGWIHLAWCVAIVALVVLGPRPPVEPARAGLEPDESQELATEEQVHDASGAQTPQSGPHRQASRDRTTSAPPPANTA